MKIQIASALALGTLLVAACSKHHSKVSRSEEKAIIGTNDFVVEEDDALRQLIGKVSLSGTPCTAFVTGTNEITTAYHCFQEENEVNDPSFTTSTGAVTAITSIVEIDRTKDRLVLSTQMAL